MYRKLKVLQTWIFIQSLIILLLAGYLILLTVWLNPFFPMNYSDDTTTENNGATIAAEVSHLKTEMMNVTEISNNVTADVEDLEAWRAEHVQEVEDMQGTLKRHTSEIEDLQNDTVHLNSSISVLERLSRRAFNKADSSLATSNGLLTKMKQSEDALKSFKDSTEARLQGLQDEISAANLRRDEKMKQLKEDLEAKISTLANSTKTDSIALSERISDTTSTTASILARIDHFSTKKTVDTLLTNQNYINASLDFIRAEQEVEKGKLKGLKQTVDTLQTQTSSEIQSANNNIEVGLSAVQQKQREIMDNLTTKLAQERQLSQGEVAQLRSHADAEIGRLRCRLDNLTSTVGTNQDDVISQINDTSYAFTQIILHGDHKVEGEVNKTIEGVEGKFRKALDSAEKTLNTRIHVVSSLLDSYTTSIDASIQTLFSRGDEMWGNINETNKEVKKINKTLEGKFSDAHTNIWDLWQGQRANNQSISDLQTTTQALNQSILLGRAWCFNKTGDLQTQIDELSPTVSSFERNFTCLRQRVINLETEANLFNRSIRENDINVKLLINKNKVFHSGRFGDLESEIARVESKTDKNRHKLRNVTNDLNSFEEDVNANSYDLTNPLSLKFLIYDIQETQNNCECFPFEGENPPMPSLTEEEEEEEK